MSCFTSKAGAAAIEREFLAVRNGFTLAELKLPRFKRTTGAAGRRKRCITERPTVSLYLNKLLI
jgi:hypothetical protein